MGLFNFWKSPLEQAAIECNIIIGLPKNHYNNQPLEESGRDEKAAYVALFTKAKQQGATHVSSPVLEKIKQRVMLKDTVYYKSFGTAHTPIELQPE